MFKIITITMAKISPTKHTYLLRVRPIVKMFYLSKVGLKVKVGNRSALHYSISQGTALIQNYFPRPFVQRNEYITLELSKSNQQKLQETPGLDAYIENCLYQSFVNFYVGYITAATTLSKLTVNKANEHFFDLFDIDEDCFSFEYANLLYQKNKII